MPKFHPNNRMKLPNWSFPGRFRLSRTPMAIPKQFENHYIIRTSNGTHLFLISPLAYPSHVEHIELSVASCILRKAIPRLLYVFDSFLIPFIHRTEFGFRLLPIPLDYQLQRCARSFRVDDLHYSPKFDTKIHLTSATTTASAPSLT